MRPRKKDIADVACRILKIDPHDMPRTTNQETAMRRGRLYVALHDLCEMSWPEIGKFCGIAMSTAQSTAKMIYETLTPVERSAWLDTVRQIAELPKVKR